MKFGVYMFPTDYAMNPVELGRAAEERGFESLIFPEHTHIPTSRRTPFPRGGDLPLEYSHTLDPFVVIGAVAAATERIKLGTGICLVIERDTITLAADTTRLLIVCHLNLSHRGTCVYRRVLCRASEMRRVIMSDTIKIAVLTSLFDRFASSVKTDQTNPELQAERMIGYLKGQADLLGTLRSFVDLYAEDAEDDSQ